jgi:hypothetical protein
MRLNSGHFRQDLLPCPSAFYPRELREIGRRSPKGWARGLCPFHPDRRPSLYVNLLTGGFYCFSCGAKGGDVLDFIMVRDSLSFKRAAELLGAWDEHQTISAQQVHELQLKRNRDRRAKETQLAEERRRRLEACDYLHLLERLYQEDCNRLCELRRGLPERFPDEEEACWECLSLALPAIRQAEAAYLRLAEVRL